MISKIRSEQVDDVIKRFETHLDKQKMEVQPWKPQKMTTQIYLPNNSHHTRTLSVADQNSNGKIIRTDESDVKKSNLRKDKHKS